MVFYLIRRFVLYRGIKIKTCPDLDYEMKKGWKKRTREVAHGSEKNESYNSLTKTYTLR